MRGLRPRTGRRLAGFVRHRLLMQRFRILTAASAMLFASAAFGQSAECKSGVEALEQKDYTRTVDLLSQCLTLPLPKAPRAFVLRARAQAEGELGQFAAALKDAKESIALEKPRDVWPWIELALYYRGLKQWDEALTALRSALNYDEDGPGTGPGMAVYYHTGQTLHAAGRYVEATEAYTKGIPKQPDYGYALYRRALSYEALGDRLQAKRDLFRAAELAPKDGYEPEIAAKLKEYGFEVRVRTN